MMCQEVIELMQRYLDQDLDELEYEQMLGHLQQCSECTELFQRLVALSEELEQLPKVTPAYSLVDAIMPKLQRIDEGFPAVEYPAAPVMAQPEQYNEKNNNEKAAVSIDQAAGWRKRIRGLVSMRIVGGVVAAGLVLGFFVFEQQEKNSSMQDAGPMLLSSSQSKTESADSAASSGAGNSTQPKAAGAAEPFLDRNVAKEAPKPDSVPTAPAASPAPKDAEPKVSANGGGNESGALTDQLKKSVDTAPVQEQQVNQQQQAPPAGAAEEPKLPDAGDQAPASEPEVQPSEAPVNEGMAPPPVSASPERTGGAVSKIVAPDHGHPDSSGEENDSRSSMPAPDQKAGMMGITNHDSEDKTNQEEPGYNRLYSAASAGTPTALASQDKAYIASVNDNHQVIITDNQQKVLYTSPNKWTDKDKIELVEWTEGNLLTYRVSNDSGTTTYVIHLKDKTEIKK
ncbi:anti-sigma factor family protein [Paenibacillus sp. OAS669]|uniref:anti-sigma factor family protein n=1 Tax=Paenibacillus sp. OAS669 TaxID=2663821 RepID=UPI00298EFFEB|nr:zf-HC2 domain-containing protein [Paenibacillus sp. OAS669]